MHTLGKGALMFLVLLTVGILSVSAWGTGGMAGAGVVGGAGARGHAGAGAGLAGGAVGGGGLAIDPSF